MGAHPTGWLLLVWGAWATRSTWPGLNQAESEDYSSAECSYALTSVGELVSWRGGSRLCVSLDFAAEQA